LIHLQQMLGHKHLATTAIYVSLATEALVREYRKVTQPINLHTT